MLQQTPHQEVYYANPSTLQWSPRSSSTPHSGYPTSSSPGGSFKTATAWRGRNLTAPPTSFSSPRVSSYKPSRSSPMSCDLCRAPGHYFRECPLFLSMPAMAQQQLIAARAANYTPPPRPPQAPAPARAEFHPSGVPTPNPKLEVPPSPHGSIPTMSFQAVETVVLYHPNRITAKRYNLHPVRPSAKCRSMTETV